MSSLHKQIMSSTAQNQSPPELIPTALKLEQTVKLEAEDQPILRDPTEKELCQCIMMVRECFPHCHLDRVIFLLHDTLLRQEHQQREAQRRKRESLLLAGDDFLSDQSVSEIEKKKMQQEYALKFENNQANPRFYEEREIAKLFCSKGYGYPTARQYLGDSITPNRYNNVITTIVRLSYRKLEYFIIKHLNPRLPMISREELKMIKTPLVNCRNWMTERQADNFHRFVKLTYKLHTQDPEKEVAVELHDAIMTQLRKRSITYRPHRRGEDPAGWNQDMDAHLISAYLAQPNTPDLQRQLTAHFPAQRACFDQGRLRLRIERLLRLALRKLYGDRDKFGLTEPASLSEYLVCKISRASGALDVRKRLLSYYLDKDSNAMKVRWVKEVIEEYVRASRTQVQEIEDSSCEVVPKEELKAEAQLPEQGVGAKWQQALDVDLNGNKKEEEENGPL